MQLYFAVYIYSDLTIINNDLIELFWNIEQRGEGMSEFEQEIEKVYSELSDLNKKELEKIIIDRFASQELEKLEQNPSLSIDSLALTLPR